MFRLHSLKTTKEEEWDGFLDDYAGVYTMLWTAKPPQRAREQFRVYALKQTTMDKVFQTTERKPEKTGKIDPVIAYEAAKLSSLTKNELSVPTTSEFRRCANHFRVILVDEYRTTQESHRCNHNVHPVMQNEHGIRGLRRCCSTNCRIFFNGEELSPKTLRHVYVVAVLTAKFERK